MSAWTLLKVKAGRNLKDVSPLGPTFTPEKSNKQKALIHDKDKIRSAENGFFDVDCLLIPRDWFTFVFVDSYLHKL